MKILFANPACRRQTPCGRERYMLGSGVRFPWSMLKRHGQRPRFSIFPMYLGYAAGLLEKDGHDVRALDGVALDLDDESFMTRVEAFSPDLLVLEPNSAVIDDVLKLAQTLKSQHQMQIVLVGTHASACTFEIMHDNSAVDFIVRGEFEYGLQDLVQQLALQGDQHLARVEGLAYRQDGAIKLPAGKARPVTDLNQLPYPARHLFPAWFNTDHSYYFDGFNQRQPAFDMHATRGCPYRCNFCVWVQELYDNGLHRTRSIEHVVAEMNFLVDQFGAREIYFDDDNFTANRKFVFDLCDALIKQGSNIPWSAMGDAIALNEGMLEKMAEAGCIGIKFGLDSADEVVLAATDKPLKVPRIAVLVEKARKLGIKTHMTVVLGLEGETKASLDRTFEFACKIDIDSIQLSVATPLPGTRLYDTLEATGRLKLQQWDELDGYSSVVFEHDDFSRDYLEDFVARAHTRWIWSRLRNFSWVRRQTFYLGRVFAGQGVRGVYRRFYRLIRILMGDTSVVGCSGATGTGKYLRH